MIKKGYRSILKQILLVFLFPIIFFVASYVYLHDRFNYIPKVMFVTFVSIIIVAIIGLYFGFDAIKKRRKMKIKKKQILVLVVGILAVIIMLPTLDELPRWDGFFYYSMLEKACESFNFTIDSVINGFRTVHPSHAYMMFLAIGYYFFQNHLLGTMFMQMVLYVIMAITYCMLLRELFPKKNLIIYVLGSLMFMMAPLVYGIEPQISTDFGTLCYLVLFVYVSLKQKKILELWCAMLLIMSKPQGVLYYVVFYAIIFVVREYRFIKQFGKIDFIEFKRIVIRTIPGFVYIIYYCISNFSISAFSGSMNSVKGETDRITQGFGINIDYIIVKLKEIFMLNFMWVFSAIVLIGILLFLLTGIKSAKKIREEIYGIIGIGVVFLCFNCIYVTYANARYLSVGFFVISILCFAIITYFIQNKYLLMMVFTMLTGINTIASYTSIDPISYVIFDGFSVGDTEMYLPIYDDIRMYPSDIYSEPSVYNRQFTNYTKLLERTLDITEYDGTVPILLVDMSKGQWPQGQYDYINTMLEGLWGRKKLYWNDNDAKFSIDSNYTVMNVMYFSSEQIIEDQNNKKGQCLPSEAILVYLPRQDDELLSVVFQKYDLQEEYRINYREMSLNAYRVKLK